MRFFAVILAIASAAVIAAEAATLQVAPVNVELTAPTSAAQLTLRNPGTVPVNVQIRAFRWTQAGGEDTLERTGALVASPPATTLPAGSEGLVRIVRTASTPVQREESYRVLVDQLPNAARGTGPSLALAVRHSVPVFISPPDAAPPQLSWTASRQGNMLSVVASNSGGRRLKLTSLSLRDSAGNSLDRAGLVGYVLAGESKTLTFEVGTGFAPGSNLTITATADTGGISAATTIR